MHACTNTIHAHASISIKIHVHVIKCIKKCTCSHELVCRTHACIQLLTQALNYTQTRTPHMYADIESSTH